MKNKTNIEEDIKILRILVKNKALYIKNKISESEKERIINTVENVLADRERLEEKNLQMATEIAEQVYFGSMTLDQMRKLQAKANAYDSLVEKIKEYCEMTIKKVNGGSTLSIRKEDVMRYES